jgi:hypothetical protein
MSIRRIMFAVEDIENVLARLHAHGAELVWRAGAVRRQLSALLRPRPEDIVVALAEQLRLKPFELAALLEHTSLTAIINASKQVADGLNFLTGLEILVFRADNRKRF